MGKDAAFIWKVLRSTLTSFPKLDGEIVVQGIFF